MCKPTLSIIVDRFETTVTKLTVFQVKEHLNLLRICRLRYCLNFQTEVVGLLKIEFCLVSSAKKFSTQGSRSEKDVTSLLSNSIFQQKHNKNVSLPSLGSYQSDEATSDRSLPSPTPNTQRYKKLRDNLALSNNFCPFSIKNNRTHFQPYKNKNRFFFFQDEQIAISKQRKAASKCLTELSSPSFLKQARQQSLYRLTGKKI